MDCPYCKGKMKAARSSVIYHGRDFGKVYICEKYPECDSYVGCHKGNGEALGTPANAKLRKLRKRVHGLFDPLWMNGHKHGKREKCYKMLANKMQIPPNDCHIAMFDETRCLEAIAILELTNQHQID